MHRWLLINPATFEFSSNFFFYIRHIPQKYPVKNIRWFEETFYLFTIRFFKNHPNANCMRPKNATLESIWNFFYMLHLA